MNLDTKVKMEVVPQLSNAKHARRGQSAIKKNTLLWCIAYETSGFFTYSYGSKEQAIEVMNKMKKHGTDTIRFRDFNIVPSVDETLHVMPKQQLMEKLG